MSNAQKLTEEQLRERAEAYKASGYNLAATARELGISDRKWLRETLRRASSLGLLLDHPPAMPGFRVTRVADGPSGRSVEQKPDHGEAFSVPAGQAVKGVSALVDQDGNEIVKWIKTGEDKVATEAAMQAALAGFLEQVPRAEPTPLDPAAAYNAELLNQFTITDLHMGSLCWGEETGTDYDLKIAEQLVLDWFATAIRMSPNADTAILAQIGDLLHFDGLEQVTPTNRHILDADSRFAKIVRVVIRTLRRVITMLLEKHQHVHVIMADANHDPASEIWLREMLAAFYEHESRISVNRSPSTYYAYEWGDVALFYHHGHRRKIKEVDDVFVGKFRELYGRTKFAYGHLGHLHSDELISTNLMKVERHETLAGRSSFEANGGWLSGRSAKVISYHKAFGEVGRITLTPEMVARHEAEAKSA